MINLLRLSGFKVLDKDIHDDYFFLGVWNNEDKLIGYEQESLVFMFDQEGFLTTIEIDT